MPPCRMTATLASLLFFLCRSGMRVTGQGRPVVLDIKAEKVIVSLLRKFIFIT